MTERVGRGRRDVRAVVIGRAPRPHAGVPAFPQPATKVEVPLEVRP